MVHFKRGREGATTSNTRIYLFLPTQRKRKKYIQEGGRGKTKTLKKQENEEKSRKMALIIAQQPLKRVL